MKTSFPNAEFLASAAAPGQYPEHTRIEVALAGRSNVGKSSFVNALARRKSLAYVSKQPGRTQTINFIALDDQVCLVDLPGYGYAKAPGRVKAAWGGMIEGYLTTRGSRLAAVILLIDGRHGPTPDDLMMWEWLDQTGTESLVVATKWDKVKRSGRDRRLGEMRQALQTEVVPFSAETGEGRDAALRYIAGLLS